MRTGEKNRITKETAISVRISLDGDREREIDTGIAFFDHMLDAMAKQGFFGLKVHCQGDLEVDSHHTVEDTGIVFGQALAEAVGDKAGIFRFGNFMLPMDEVLALVALDFSGRPFFCFDADLPQGIYCGQMEAQLAEEFFRAVAMAAGLTLHIKVLSGKNAHHILEALFKGFGRALAQAVAFDERVEGIPSTKGAL